VCYLSESRFCNGLSRRDLKTHIWGGGGGEEERGGERFWLHKDKLSYTHAFFSPFKLAPKFIM
jgi:hypothetical protein